MDQWVHNVNKKAKELDDIVLTNRHIDNDRMSIILAKDNQEYVDIAQSLPPDEDQQPTTNNQQPKIITPYDPGTRVLVKLVNKVGKVFADAGGDLISVRFDDGKTHAYPRKDIAPVAGTSKPTQPKLLDTPTQLDTKPDNVVVMPKPKNRTIPAGTRKQVTKMLDRKEVSIDHLLEIRELVDELIEKRQKELV